MRFDTPYPLQLNRAGRWVLAIWTACDLVLLGLLMAAWLK